MFGSNSGPGGPANKNQMDPAELKNLLIFFVIASLFYFAYDAYILKPQREALQQQRELAAQTENLPDTNMQAEEEEKAAESAPLPRDQVLGQTRRILLENAHIKGSINLTGGRIDDIALKDHFITIEKKDNVVLLAPSGTQSPRFIEHGWVAGDESMTMPDSRTIWQIRGNDRLTPENPVRLYWENPQGLQFERIYTIDDDYLITVEQTITNPTSAAVTVFPYALVSQHGIREGFMDTWLSHEGPIGYIGEELHEINYSALQGDGPQRFRAASGWAGITDKYWLSAVAPAAGMLASYRFRHIGAPGADDIREGRYQIDYTGSAMDIPPGGEASALSRAYAGAKEVLVLERYEDQHNIPKFDLAVNFGWFWFLSKPFFYALHYLHELIGNMGFAIILLTIAIRSAVFPLTNTSYKSFGKMKKVQPQIMELREAYGDDKQKLQQELMKLYQKEGVNPMAGCFPIFLQIPIFFALYKVLFVTIEMRHAPFFGWIEDLSVKDPTSIFNLFGLIPWDPPALLVIGVWPCLMCVIMVFQKKLNPPPQDQLQKDMMNYFPFIITFIMSKFAAGLVIYWTFSALIGLIQQIIIMKRMGAPIHLFGESPEEEAMDAAIEKGPDVHPEANMVEDEVEKAIFGEDDSFPKADDDKPKKEIKPPKRKKSKKKK